MKNKILIIPLRLGMQKKLSTWQFIFDNLKKHTGVVMLYVLESAGSSPGRQGFLMAVNAKGEMSGSIGGGVMEHKFVELAKNKLLQDIPEHSLHQQFHDKVAAKNQSGMICSGEQTIFIYTIQPTEIFCISDIIGSLEQNKNGAVQLSPEGIHFSDEPAAQDFFYERKEGDDFLYKEKTGYQNHLYIIGGGHCSLAFSQLMATMDFYIHVYDEREGLNTLEENNFVQERKVLGSYENLKDLVPSGKNNYVVIMTFGYRTDEIALRALLGKEFAYLGLLGSKKKIEKMFTNLKLEGVASAVIDNIHSPIGISIKSQTPEEIAVSIAAEIIQVKNRNLP